MAKLNLENNRQRLTVGLSNEEFQRLDEMQKLTGAS
jgi:hypothetical protein